MEANRKCGLVGTSRMMILIDRDQVLHVVVHTNECRLVYETFPGGHTVIFAPDATRYFAVRHPRWIPSR